MLGTAHWNNNGFSFHSSSHGSFSPGSKHHKTGNKSKHFYPKNRFPNCGMWAVEGFSFSSSRMVIFSCGSGGNELGKETALSNGYVFMVDSLTGTREDHYHHQDHKVAFRWLVNRNFSACSTPILHHKVVVR